MRSDLDDFREGLGYRFEDPALLELALTHRSAADAPHESNQRLEFLGDAAIGMAVSAALYRLRPRASEGELTKLKARFVCNAHLASVGRSLRVGRFLRLAKGEEVSSGRDKQRLVADCVEAVVGAVFLDGGMAAASQLAEKLILGSGAVDDLDGTAPFANSKGVLQERMQASGQKLPSYAVSREGPSHRPVFHAEVSCGHLSAAAVGSSKKRAEQRAAARMLERLDVAQR